MTQQNPPFEKVTSTEAAERQLRIAIRLFFERKDMVAVHTLAAAAQEILARLAKPRGFKGMYEHLNDLIRPDKRKEVIDHFRKTQNFFKHAAGKNSDESLDFYYEVTPMYLFDAAQLCLALTGRFTAETLVFFGWFIAKYPDVFIAEKPEIKATLEPMKGLDVNNFPFLRDTINFFERYGLPKTTQR